MQENINRNYQGDTEDTIDIRQLVEQYGFYWKWIVVAVILSLAVAHIYLRYTTRMYGASAKVMVLDKENASVELTALGTLAPVNSNTALDDQIQIIRSSKLMSEVVRKNKLYITYHELGRINDTEVLADNLPFSLEIVGKTPEQQEELSLAFKLAFSKNGEVEVSQDNNKLTAQLGKPFVWDGVKLVLTRKGATPPADRSFMVAITPLEAAANTLKGALTVGRSEKSNTILKFGYTAPSKEKAEIIIRDLIGAYDDDLSNDKNKVTQASTNFINERLDLISQDLQRADKRVEDFKTSNQLLDVQSNAGITQGELTTYEKQLFDLQLH